MSAVNMERILHVEACLRQGTECHEEVSRKGELQPCGKPAVALRDWAEGDTYYPVCATHARGFCIPLIAPEDAAALVTAVRNVLNRHPKNQHRQWCATDWANYPCPDVQAVMEGLQ